MKKRSSFFRLLGFEWKKNFLSPWMLLFLIALLGVNGWKLNWEYEKKPPNFPPMTQPTRRFIPSGAEPLPQKTFRS